MSPKRCVSLLFAVFFVLSAFAAGATDIFDTVASGEHIKKGKVLMYQKKYDKAAAEFDEALRINPDSAQALYLTGYCRYRQNRMPAAYDAFSSAYEIDDDYAPAYGGK